MPTGSNPSRLAEARHPPRAGEGQEAVGLRVLFVATSGGEGGIERYSVRLATLLRARGVSVTYACRHGGFLESQCAAHGIPTVAWAVRNSGDVKASLTLARLLREQRTDVVHVHSRRDYVPAVLGAALARRQSGLRLLLHAHLIRALGEPPRLAGRFFRWGADGVIAVSDAVRARVMSEHGLPADFVPLLPNGVATDDFAPPGEARAREWRSAHRRAWGVPEEALVVGMMGRLNAKGQSSLLAVAPEIVRAFPNVWFVLVGPEGENGDGERLRRRAETLGITGRLVLPGMTEDVSGVMAGFDVLAHLPSDESFGLALAEAMAAGLPTVATDIGGCREVVEDGITGTLVPLADAGALTSALMSLFNLETGAERRAKFGAAGRRRVVAEFSLNTQVERLHQLYQSLISTP